MKGFESIGRCRRGRVTIVLGVATITRETQYNDATNTRKEIDPLGESVEYQHDPLDRLRFVKWTEAGVQKKTEYQYDEVDNRVAQIDAKLNQTTWEFDPMDRMTDHFGFRIAGCGFEEVPRRCIHPLALEGRSGFLRTVTGVGARKSAIRNPQSAMLGWEWTYNSLNRLIGRAELPIGISDPNYGQLVTTWCSDSNADLTPLVSPRCNLLTREND